MRNPFCDEASALKKLEMSSLKGGLLESAVCGCTCSGENNSNNENADSTHNKENEEEEFFIG